MKTEHCKEYLKEMPFTSEHLWYGDIHGIPFGLCLRCGMPIEEWKSKIMTNMPQEPQSETPNHFEQWLKLLEQREVYLKACPLNYILLSTKERSDLCSKVRTLERELGEVRQERNNCKDLWIQGIKKDEQLQQELSQVRGVANKAVTKLEEVNDLLKAERRMYEKASKERDLLAKQLEEANKKIVIHEWEILETRKDREKLAKQNYKMREALEWIRSNVKTSQGCSNGNLDIWVKSDEALQVQNTSSLIVLSRAEVEQLPCNCSGVFAKEGDYKCRRCLLLERFTK